MRRIPTNVRLEQRGLKLIIVWPNHYADGSTLAEFCATLGKYEIEEELVKGIVKSFNLWQTVGELAEGDTTP
tara:strand:+ start:590 stop:805 length:216 start_codon:yes stop_codon:yes gene_type:complete